MTPFRQELETLINRYYPQEQRLEEERMYERLVEEGRIKRGDGIGLDYMADKGRTADEMQNLLLAKYMLACLEVWDKDNKAA